MKKIILMTTAIAFLAGCQGLSDKAVSLDQTTSPTATVQIDESFYSAVEAKMKTHNLPGFSLAVFANDKIVYSNEWGVKASGSADLINNETAFSTASMSKPITALLCIMLEEKGLIDLDEPISDSLTSWSLPESHLTQDTPVTWKHLLSHTAGTTQHGFADFYEGDDIPSLVDSLQGKLPRYDKPIDFKFKPGTDWSYSGGGYTIVQLALQDHFKKPLHVLAAENIFKPLGMKHTTMVQPNEPGFLSNVANVHNSDGGVIRSGLAITPQVAASGMWSTPTDLAKFSMAFQQALGGNKASVITPMAAKTATDIITLKRSSGASLGWARGFGFGNVDWIRHDGSNTGVGGDMLISAEGNFGFVFFANGEKGNRFPVDRFVRREVIEMMKWEQPTPNAKTPPEALIQSIKGPYKDFLYNVGMPSEIVSSNGRVYLVSPVFEHFLGKDRSEMIYVGNNSFKIMDYPNLVRFNLDNQNKVKSLTMLRNGDERLSTNIDVER